jgi:aconitase A
MSLSVISKDSFKCKTSMTVDGKTYEYFSLALAEKNGLPGISKLPFSLKVLLENMLRFEDGVEVKKADIEATVGWLERDRNRLPTGARLDAGFHGCPGRGRPRGYARWHECARR